MEQFTCVKSFISVFKNNVLRSFHFTYAKENINFKDGEI